METNFKRDQSNVIGLFFEYAKKNNLVAEEPKIPVAVAEVEQPTND